MQFFIEKCDQMPVQTFPWLLLESLVLKIFLKILISNSQYFIQNLFLKKRIFFNTMESKNGF